MGSIAELDKKLDKLLGLVQTSPSTKSKTAPGYHRCRLNRFALDNSLSITIDVSPTDLGYLVTINNIAYGPYIVRRKTVAEERACAEFLKLRNIRPKALLVSGPKPLSPPSRTQETT